MLTGKQDRSDDKLADAVVEELAKRLAEKHALSWEPRIQAAYFVRIQTQDTNGE